MLTGWLIELTGIIVLSVLADIALPKGRTNKILKCVFSFVCMFVIIQPILWVKEGKFDIANISYEHTQVVDGDFIDIVSGQRLKLMEKSCDEELKKKGYDAETSIEGSYAEEIIIEKIYIKLNDSVISENESHILEIKETVSDLFNLDAEKIIIYE